MTFIILIVLLAISSSGPVNAEIPSKNLPVFTEKEKEYIRHHPVWRTFMDEEWAPYSFYEYGESKGYTHQYLQLMARKIGVELQFIRGYLYEEAIDLLKNKEIALLPNMKAIPEWQDTALFSEESLASAREGIFVKRSNMALVDRFGLNGKYVAVVAGSHREDAIRRMYPFAKIVPTKTSLEAIKQVVAGRADVAIDATLVLDFYITKYFLSDYMAKTFISDGSFGTEELRIGMRNDHPLLKSIIDKAMATITNEEIAQLHRQWLELSEVDNNMLELLNTREKAYLTATEQLTYCTLPDWLPFEGLQKGEHVGISSDLIQLYAQRLDIRFIHIPTPTWSEFRRAVTSQECDMVPLLPKSDEFKKYMNFGRPYFNSSVVVATRSDQPFVADFHQLENVEIAVTESFPIKDLLSNKYRNLRFREIESLEQGMSLVKSGVVFGIIDALPVVSQKIQADSPGLKINGKLEENLAFSMASPKKQPNLLAIYEKLVDTIDLKTRQKITNDWMSVRYEQKMDLTLLWQVMFGALLVIAALVYRQSMLKKLNQELERLSTRDDLTGLLNRRSINNILSEQFALQQRYASKPVSIILLDIDHFKSINDVYGHIEGDNVLKAVSTCLKTSVRQTDLVGRWGGEEFLIICPATSEKGAARLAEDLRKQIEALEPAPVETVTASFGVTEIVNGGETRHAVSLADTALYASKENGRNCVTMASKVEHSFAVPLIRA